MAERHVEPHDARGLAQLLAEAEEAFRQVEEDALADLDLRPWMLRVLDLLARDGPQAPTDVARVLRVSQPTVSGWIAEMTARDLIERLRVEGDGRRATIRLTEHGASARSTGNDRVRRRQLRLASVLDPVVQAEVVAALQRVIAAARAQ